jgi:hypothetical protein
MSVAMVTQMPAEFTTETYDAVNEKAGLEENPPQGMVFHALGTSKDGSVILDVWESEDDFEAFRTGRLNPALEEVVGSEVFAAMPVPERSVYDVHHVMKA